MKWMDESGGPPAAPIAPLINFKQVWVGRDYCKWPGNLGIKEKNGIAEHFEISRTLWR